LANKLAESIGATVISTDEVRRELQHQGRISGPAGELNAGLYTPENIEVVYDEVLRRAHLVLAGGHTVILDGTWRERGRRRAAADVAAASSTPVLEFVCTTTLEDAQARIRSRGETTSDATPGMAAALAPETDDWDGAHSIDTRRPVEQTVAEAQAICCLAI
jgi:predicted kinase